MKKWGLREFSNFNEHETTCFQDSTDQSRVFGQSMLLFHQKHPLNEKRSRLKMPSWSFQLKETNQPVCFNISDTNSFLNCSQKNNKIFQTNFVLTWVFLKFFTVFDGIQTANLLCPKRPIYQLSHHHCSPKNLYVVSTSLNKKYRKAFLTALRDPSQNKCCEGCPPL